MAGILFVPVAPFLVAAHMVRAGLVAVHTGEEHRVVVLVLLAIARQLVAVGFVRVHFHLLAVQGSSLFADDLSVLVAQNARRKCLAEEQRRLAVLLAVQVFGEREDFVRRVLVHGQLGRRADDNLREGRVADQNGEEAKEDVACKTCIDPFAEVEDQTCQHNGYDNADEPAVAGKRHTAQGNAQDEHNLLRAVGGLFPVHQEDADGKEDQYEEEVESGSGVEAEAQGVDKEQLGGAGQLDHTRNHSVQDEEDQQYRYDQGAQ